MISIIIQLLSGLLLTGIALALSVLALRELLKLDNRRRKQLEDRVSTMVKYSDFSPKQQYWIMNAAAAKMISYQLIGRNSSLRFYTLNEGAIVILGMNIAIPAIVGAFFPAQAMHGLALMGFLSAVGVIATGFDKLEQNSARWQDCHEIASLIEDALNELLTDTPDIPLDKQYQQFVKEYEAISKLERELQKKRVKAAQAVASEQAEDLKSGIAQGREEYRAAYEQKPIAAVLASVPGQMAPISREETKAAAWDTAARLRTELGMTGNLARPETIAVEPEIRQDTIEGAGNVTIDEFINYSMSSVSGGGDDDEPLSGVFKSQW
jgi:hypothetical protein